MIEGNLFHGTGVEGPFHILAGPSSIIDAIDARSVVSAQVCGNIFEAYDPVRFESSFLLWGVPKEAGGREGDFNVSGNIFTEETARIGISGEDVRLFSNGLGSPHGLQLRASEAVAHFNAFENTTEGDPMNEIGRVMDASSNWWDDPDGPNIVDREGVFSEGGGPGGCAGGRV